MSAERLEDKSDAFRVHQELRVEVLKGPVRLDARVHGDLQGVVHVEQALPLFLLSA